MDKFLVIVESPAKAKTINKYLGDSYIVKSSIGHIRDLLKGSAKSNSVGFGDKFADCFVGNDQKNIDSCNSEIKKTGIDPNTWDAAYGVLENKKKVVSELQDIAKKVTAIYLATDMDREGEAIAWHLQQTIGDDYKYHRVVFNEITRSAIQEAFNKATVVDNNKVNAQQARRFLDRIVGFMISPLLWNKIARGLSAGRVQSVAVKLVVEKEKSIKCFKPVEFWDFAAKLKCDDKEFSMDLEKYQGKKIHIQNQEAVDKIVADLVTEQFIITKKTKKLTSSKPSAPFITSTLQQVASTNLGFSVKQTMMLAQNLYELGYITYMRTDSTSLSDEAIDSVRSYIEDKFGDKYLPAEKILYVKSKSQEAHEAIRPTDVNISMHDLEGLQKEHCLLYDLIWCQFVACQMTDANYHATSLITDIKDYTLRVKGRTLLFDGWTKVQSKMHSKQDIELPDVNEGDVLTLLDFSFDQKFTKPPARYTESSLVKDLENKSIGRPSTYASIISTIEDRGYVVKDKKRLYATKIGEIVSHHLENHFSDLMDYGFTAQMEENLDDVNSGKLNWESVLDDFSKSFLAALLTAKRPDDQGGMPVNTIDLLDFNCKKCSNQMGVKLASTGMFLGCSGYNLKGDDRCKHTESIIYAQDLLSEDKEIDHLLTNERCSKCSMVLEDYFIDSNHKLVACSNYPICKSVSVEQGDFDISSIGIGEHHPCNKCESSMSFKKGRFGDYYSCSNENCNNTRKALKDGSIAPVREDPLHLHDLKCVKSDAYFVLREGASGIFLAASTFPKSRETRAPTIKELQQNQHLLWKKYQYLLSAPTEDSNGNTTVVRFSRKLQCQYVGSITKEGKPSQFKLFYDNGSWGLKLK